MRLALLIVVMLGACVEPPPPSSTTQSLRAPAQGPQARVPLVPLTLSTQADYDALEDRWLARRERADLLAVLEAYAAAQTEPDPLLLQRIAVLYADQVAVTEDALRITLEAGTKLRDAAPGSAHSAWLNGWVLWQFLTRGGIGKLDGASRDVAKALVQEWQSLLALAPDYVGPRKHDAAKVRVELARIETALAEGAAPPKPTPPAAPQRLATAGEIEVLAQMARFEQAGSNSRRALCNEWLARKKTDPTPLFERRLLAACHFHLGNAKEAIEQYDALAQAEPFDACAALVALRERVGTEKVDRALAASGKVFTCP